MRSLPVNRRTGVLGLLALALLLGVMLFGAPATSHLESGSTWHRGPAGYSAWYESLEQQGITVERWQRPVETLLEQLGEPEDTTVTLIQNRAVTPETLLVVLPGFIGQGDVSNLLPWPGCYTGRVATIWWCRPWARPSRSSCKKNWAWARLPCLSIARKPPGSSRSPDPTLIWRRS